MLSAVTRPLSKQAVRNGLAGYSCSEAILVTYGPEFGLTRETAMRMASGLAGGIGHSKGICGAVSAACLVLGLAVGPSQPDEVFARQQSILLCSEFLEQFAHINGSVLCSKLCFKSLPVDADATTIRKSGIPEQLIRNAAELTESLLATV